MHHWIFGALAIFCWLHAYRDYLQSKGNYHSWFTRFGHVWDAPQYEIHSMVVAIVLGAIFIFLAVR